MKTKQNVMLSQKRRRAFQDLYFFKKVKLLEDLINDIMRKKNKIERQFETSFVNISLILTQ